MIIKKTTTILITLFFLLTLSPLPLYANYNNEGIGILGDSNSDEYRANDNRGAEYSATTFNWVELLANKRNLNFGPWGSWGEPRRSGYKYNWSRSGQLTKDLIDAGQAEGLASQIRNGEVKYVFIQIGTNDFNFWNNSYQDVYNNSTNITLKVNTIITKMNQAIDIIKQAGATQIVMTGIGDPNIYPPIALQFPIKSNRDRVTNAINTINTAWKTKANNSGVVFVDLNEWGTQNIIQKLDSNGNIYINNVAIKVFSQGNEPHNLRLGDSAGHMGTVANGIMANTWFLEPFNNNFNFNITPFTNHEILTNAGISSPTPIPTNTTAPPTPTSTPLSRPCPLLGDTNFCDGVVNTLDFTYLSSKFGTNDPKADLKQDGIINVLDYSILSSNFGNSL